MPTVPNNLTAGQTVTEPDMDSYYQAIIELQAQQIVNELQLSSSASQNVLTGTWVPLNWVNTDYLSGSGLGANTGGISIAATGRYCIEGECTLATSAATNRRAIGIGPVSVGVPVGITPLYGAPAPSQPTIMEIGRSVSLTAGDVVTIWARQDTGATLIATDRRIMVRRIS